METSDLDAAAEVFDFVARWMRDREQHRELPLAEYLARFPRHQAEVARQYLALTADASAPARDDGAPREGRVGGYTIVRSLGHGGQGMVFLARDEKLGRLVALKRLPELSGAASLSRVERLRREVEIVARLDHPGICAVYDAGLEREPYYVAMRYVAGETLAQILARRRTGPQGRGDGASREGEELPCAPSNAAELRRVLVLIERVARALHAAHECGVVHRDVKPANVMVQPDDAPVVLDFGLARLENSELLTLTRSGEVFGTPAYMSPEQIEGSAEADRRADVYSLGVTLYECLTLRRPFVGESVGALQRAILHEPVPDPRRWNPSLPRDLVVVLRTALEKERARRYANALDLAEDLRRVAQHEPILARPPGLALRFVRWLQRSPRLAAATLGLFLALAAGLVAALLLLERVRRENESKQGQVLAGLAQAEAQSRPVRALLLALEAARRSSGEHVHNALYAALDSACIERVLPTAAANGIVAVGDGCDLAVVEAAGRSVHVFELSSGRRLCTIDLPARPVSVALSPDEALVVVTTEAGSARVADARTGVVRARRARSGLAAAFSRDGRFVATTTPADEVVRLWVARSGELVRELAGSEGTATRLAFAANDVALWAWSAVEIERVAGSGISRFDLASGERSGFPRDPLLKSLALSEDGRWSAFGYHDGRVVLTDLVSSTARVLEHRGPIESMTFSPGAERLVIGFYPLDVVRERHSGLWVWSLPAGVLEAELAGHDLRPVTDLAFSGDGQRLASCSWNGSTRIWDLSDRSLVQEFPGLTPVYQVHWSPRGERVVVVTTDVFVWNVARMRYLPRIAAHAEAVSHLEFDRAGRRLVTASVDGTAKVWDPDTGRCLLGPLEAHAGAVNWATFDPAGERILTAGDDGRARLFGARDGAPCAVLEGHRARVTIARFAPDGGAILTASDDGTARLWGASGEPGAVLAHGTPLQCALFSPDGGFVATGDAARTRRIFDARTGAELVVSNRWEARRLVPTDTRVYDLAFSGDGALLASTAQDVMLRLIDARDGTPRRELSFNGGLILFREQRGDLVAASRWHGRLMRLEPGGDTHESGIGHASRITSLRLAPGEELALTTSLDRTARLWDVETLQEVARFSGHAAAVLDGAIRPDGRWLATGDKDGVVRIWPVDPLELAQRVKPSELTESERRELGL